jgi:iron complex outermembrane receptor protein
MNPAFLSLLLASAAPAEAPVTADVADAPAGEATPASRPRDIIVTAPVRTSERDVLQGTSVVTGEELTRSLAPTIGETLARQPGVSATSFGPAASRPILRGFQGDRIRVLTDGIGSFDASNTSVDHAVVIDPLLAERIEVLRGPAALLFGSSAVGGVVNVIDRRIPRIVPEKGYRLDAIATYGSAADQRSGEAAADVAVTDHIVLHADGSYLKANDLRTGEGYLLSPAARRAALSQVGQPQEVEEGEEPIDFAGSAALRDRLPNSAIETWTAGVGAAIITDTGNLGLSYSHYDSLYGVPIRYATEVGQEQEAPRIDMVQNRFDLRGEVQTGGGFLDSLRVRAGYANYRHYELEPNGEIGTAFYNKAFEGRLEAIQAQRGAWRGASGVQISNRIFEADGEEAFLPRNETNQFGVFTLQQLDYGALKAEGGLRYERTDLAARGALDSAFFRGGRAFDAVSGSLGASYGLGEAVRVGLNVSRTERTPTAEELFAFGPHAGTQAYEIGNPDFRLEKSWGLEGTLHVHGDGYSFDGSAYYTWFNNYISENLIASDACAGIIGETPDLPCYQFQQRDARYWGLEGDASVRLATFGDTMLNADVLGDYVRATIVDQGPAPRIPPMRVLGGLEAQGSRFGARAEVEHVFEQDRVAQYETSTPAYTMVNASISFRPFADERTSILVSANNLFDELARRHSSYLKDFAPLAGRDVRVTLKVGI